MKRLLDALRYFQRTRFTWRTAWRHARPIGGWRTVADDEGNVQIVPVSH
jgi:hypothetical protein